MTADAGHAMILEAIRRVQSLPVGDGDPHGLFDEMLGQALRLTESEYGFVGEIIYTTDGNPHLRSYSATHAGWHEEARDRYRASSQAESTEESLKAIFDRVLRSGHTVFAQHDGSDSGGASERPHPLRTVIGLPLHHGEGLVGVIGLGNREAGYDVATVAFLQPFTATCATVISAYQNEQRRRLTELSLQQSEEQFRSVTENALDLVSILRRDGTVRYASPSHGRILGYTPAELIGHNFFSFVHPEDSLKATTAAPTRADQQGSDFVEFRFRHRDGSWRVLEGVGRDVHDASGVSGIVVNARDVTERKRDAAELRNALSLLAATLESTTDGILVVDLQQRIVSFNRKFVEMWSIPQAALAPGTDGGVMRLVAAQLQDPEAARTKVQQLASSPEAEESAVLDCHDGRMVELYSQPQRIAGVSVGRVWSFRDITERRRAEQRQREEAWIWATLARVGQEMIASVDAPAILDRLCALAAEALECDFARTYLWHPEERVYTLVASHGDSPEQWEAMRLLHLTEQDFAPLREQLDRHQVAAFDMAACRRSPAAARPLQDGVTRSLYVALRRGEELIGILSTGYRRSGGEFTAPQQRLASGVAQLASLALANARLFEELESVNRLRADFVATMSHELRTPLHIILGYTDLLLEGEFGDLNAEQTNRLQRLGNSAQSLLELINATLDVSRIERGRMPLRLRDVQIPELMGEIDSERRELLDKPGVEYVCRIRRGLPRLRTDATKLKVVLKNLILNALKFTEHGSVTVDIRSERGGVVFSIRDTGIGMTPEALSIIFEPFRQADSAMTGGFGGAGLGLYIVRRLLEMLEGKIEVESELHRGSVFRVWLPLAIGHEEPAV
jgi:PAS domain S-box-containing protein